MHKRLATFVLACITAHSFALAQGTKQASCEPQWQGKFERLNDAVASSDMRWSLGPKGANVIAAWATFDAKRPSVLPGDGITVGHLDTGILDHPSVANNIIGTGFNFITGTPTGADRTEPGFLQFPGHGTRTASVILGQPFPDASGFSGVASGARLIPLRVANRVVLLEPDLDPDKVAMAIRAAAIGDPNFVPRRVDIISISLGGTWNKKLEQSVLLARNEGVIVIVAAGNNVPLRIVAFPAAYAGAIALAATNSQEKPWSGSSRGSKVAFAAPGENVWTAKQRTANGQTFNCVEPGTGTSFAVATTAGVAALWLSYHTTELKKFARKDIPALFERLARCTARRPSGWDSKKMGAGIIDADALLKVDLRIDEKTCPSNPSKN